MSRRHCTYSHMIRCLGFAAAFVVAVSSYSVAPSSVLAVTYPAFVFSGAGYGHGIGLSQYGSKAYAERGESAGWIVEHYFPGTMLEKPAAKPIKVNLDPAANYNKGRPSAYNGGFTSTRWKVRAGWPGMDIVLRSSTRTVTLPDSAGPYSFEASSTKVAVSDKDKHRVSGSPFAGIVSLVMTGTVSPALLQVVGRSGPFMTKSVTPSTDVRYRGSLLIRSNGAKLKLLDELPMDSYLYGVVPRESPASWHIEALKAQAIVARSYAYVGAGELYCDTKSQMYNGYSHGTRGTESSKMHEDSRSNTAVSDTAGTCATYEGNVVRTYFCSSSGGYTANVVDIWGGTDIPYLRGVPDPYGESPYDPWTSPVALDGMKLAKALASQLTSSPAGAGSSVYVKSIVIHRAWPSGFARTVDVTWSKGAKSMHISAERVRVALGLRSNKFFVNAEGGRLQSSDRYLEAVAASTRMFASAGSAKSVIVVNGDDTHYADVASAVSLSGVARGPVLLVRAGSVPAAVSAEVARLGATKLYIVGDSRAVSAAVAAQLKGSFSATERLGGADRYKTSAIVARKMVSLGASSSKAVLCSGNVWSDAAIAGAIAGGARRPLLLTSKGSLSAPAASVLKDLRIAKTTVVGGPDALATATITQVCSITKENTPAKRIGVTGDRYATAAEAAAWSVSSLDCSASTVYVATGRAIPDAFIAAGLAVRTKHPMLLTSTYTPSAAARDYILDARKAIKSVTIVGRQTAVGIACAFQLQSDGH